MMMEAKSTTGGKQSFKISNTDIPAEFPTDSQEAITYGMVISNTARVAKLSMHPDQFAAYDGALIAACLNKAPQVVQTLLLQDVPANVPAFISAAKATIAVDGEDAVFQAWNTEAEIQPEAIENVEDMNKFLSRFLHLQAALKGLSADELIGLEFMRKAKLPTDVKRNLRKKHEESDKTMGAPKVYAFAELTKSLPSLLKAEFRTTDSQKVLTTRTTDSHDNNYQNNRNRTRSWDRNRSSGRDSHNDGGWQKNRTTRGERGRSGSWNRTRDANANRGRSGSWNKNRDSNDSRGRSGSWNKNRDKSDDRGRSNSWDRNKRAATPRDGKQPYRI
jgi:hypothetical protein